MLCSFHRGRLIFAKIHSSKTHARTHVAKPNAFRFSRTCPMKWPIENRAVNIGAALALIFGSSYSAARVFVSASLVGDWTGLPQYVSRIRTLRSEVLLWEIAAAFLPFLAAAFLAFGRSSKDVGTEVRISTSDHLSELRSSMWASSALLRYFVCLLISIMGVAGCLFLISFLGFVLSKL